MIADGNVLALKMAIYATEASTINGKFSTDVFYTKISEIFRSIYEPRFSPQVIAILNGLPAVEYMTASQISKTLGIKSGALNAQLVRMIEKGVVKKDKNKQYRAAYNDTRKQDRQNSENKLE